MLKLYQSLKITIDSKFQSVGKIKNGEYHKKRSENSGFAFINERKLILSD